MSHAVGFSTGVFVYLFHSVSWGELRAPGKELADAGPNAMELGEPGALGRVEEQAEGGLWSICESKEQQRRHLCMLSLVKLLGANILQFIFSTC